MLVLEAVERRELKPSLVRGVLGPGLSCMKGLSMGNLILFLLFFFFLFNFFSSPICSIETLHPL